MANTHKTYSMKGLVIPAMFLIVAALIFSFNNTENNAIRVSYDPAPTRHYVKTGSSATAPSVKMSPTSIFHVNGVVPTASNGATLDVSWLSSLGITTIVDVMVVPTKNTTAPNDVPTVAITSRSLTAINYNITQGNNATVAIAGINVLSGTPNIFVPTASLSSISLDFTITAY